MNDRPRISSELWPHVTGPDAEAIDRVAERLEAERPLPRAGLQGELRARLETLGERAPSLWAPGRVRLAIAAYAGSGALLLAIAALGLAGAGPLAP